MAEQGWDDSDDDELTDILSDAKDQARSVLSRDPNHLVYWCVCATSDCSARLFGPYLDREIAELDTRSGGTTACEYAHFVTSSHGFPEGWQHGWGSMLHPGTIDDSSWQRQLDVTSC